MRARTPDAVQSALEVAMRRHADSARLAAAVDQLENALERRAVIERAKGILMERHSVDERAAFELLRAQARSSNRSVVEPGPRRPRRPRAAAQHQRALSGARFSAPARAHPAPSCKWLSCGALRVTGGPSARVGRRATPIAAAPERKRAPLRAERHVQRRPGSAQLTRPARGRSARAGASTVPPVPGSRRTGPGAAPGRPGTRRASAAPRPRVAGPRARRRRRLRSAR